jgi:hypothetical protein
MVEIKELNMWNEQEMEKYSAYLDAQETAVLEAVYDHNFSDFEKVRVYAELKLEEIDIDYLRSVWNMIVYPEKKVYLNVE